MSPVIQRVVMRPDMKAAVVFLPGEDEDPASYVVRATPTDPVGVDRDLSYDAWGLVRDNVQSVVVLDTKYLGNPRGTFSVKVGAVTDDETVWSDPVSVLSDVRYGWGQVLRQKLFKTLRTYLPTVNGATVNVMGDLEGRPLLVFSKVEFGGVTPAVEVQMPRLQIGKGMTDVRRGQQYVAKFRLFESGASEPNAAVERLDLLSSALMATLDSKEGLGIGMGVVNQSWDWMEGDEEPEVGDDLVWKVLKLRVPLPNCEVGKLPYESTA